MTARLKRAIEAQEAVVGLVILAVVVLISISVVFKLGAVVDRRAEVDLCKTTVAVAARDPTNFIDINCPTDEVLIKEDGAYVRTLRTKTYGKFLSIDSVKAELKAKGVTDPDDARLMRALVERVLAEEAILCWDKMGAGTLDPFKSKLLQLNAWRCVSCAVVRLDDPVKQKVGQLTMGSLLDYLKNTKMSNGDKSIHDYLHPTFSNIELSAMYQNVINEPLQEGVTVSYVQTDTSTLTLPAEYLVGLAGGDTHYFAFTSFQLQGGNTQCDALY